MCLSRKIKKKDSKGSDVRLVETRIIEAVLYLEITGEMFQNSEINTFYFF